MRRRTSKQRSNTKKKSEKVMKERNVPQDQLYPFILKRFLRVSYSSTTQSAPSAFCSGKQNESHQSLSRRAKGARFDVVTSCQM